MMTVEDLEAKARWFERLLGSVEADAPRHDELAAKLAQRDTDMGQELAAHVRRITSRAHIEMVVSRIRSFARGGELKQAEQTVINFENHWAAIKDMHFEIALRSREGSKSGGKKGGQAPKRRAWADMLAEHLAQKTTNKNEAWELIPDGHPLEFWSKDGEVEVYRDGETIVCVAGETERTMTRANFLKRYFPPRGQ
jgi:hypothetical protein